MVERIKALCKLHGTSLAGLEKTLGFANASIAKSNEKIQANRLKAIADYFGVSMQYLFSGDDITPVYSHDPELNECITQLIQLPQETRQFIYTTVKAQHDVFIKKHAHSA